jgi:hypothetical protein
LRVSYQSPISGLNCRPIVASSTFRKVVKPTASYRSGKEGWQMTWINCLDDGPTRSVVVHR